MSSSTISQQIQEWKSVAALCSDIADLTLRSIQERQFLWGATMTQILRPVARWHDL